jgi:hypothetical protein
MQELILQTVMHIKKLDGTKTDVYSAGDRVFTGKTLLNIGGFGMRRTKVLICLLTLSLNKEIIRTTTCWST